MSVYKWYEIVVSSNESELSDVETDSSMSTVFPRPGVYLLPEFADPALIQDWRLYGTGVYKHNDVIRAVYIVGTGRHK